MHASSLLEELIHALKKLPGTGPKSARRMAYYLLQHDRDSAHRLATVLDRSLKQIHHCQQCNNFTEQEICDLCSDSRRDQSTLCIVEMPADLLMMEQTMAYNGLYYVLMGKLSPLDGVVARNLHLDKLVERCRHPVQEIIIATNFTVEGDATAHYLTTLLKSPTLKISRIARGLPVGGELEQVDSGTLAQAMQERRAINHE